MVRSKKTGNFILALSIIVSLFAGTVAPLGIKTVKAQDDYEPQYETCRDENGNEYEECRDNGNEHARYTGNGWWAEDENKKNLVPVSPSRSVNNNETVYYSIVTENDVSLCVELAKKSGNTYSNHLTTTTNNDAWFADIEQDPTKPVIENRENNIPSKSFCLESGHVYEIAITRQDDGNKSNYTIIYKDVSSNLQFMKVTAASTGTMGDDVIVHVLAQDGTFRLYDGKVSDFGLWENKVNHGRKERDRLISCSELEDNAPEDYTIPTGLIQEAKDGDYPDYFLKEDVQTVNITMPEKNLDYILQHAVNKPSAMTTSVKIGNSPKIGYASLKTKGNYTLRHTAENTESDRFSFTINFGKYIKKNWGNNGNTKKQNFYGCHKISFNNCLNDKTFLKEYNAMRLMDEMGLPTPEYGIAKLTINGEYYGVYFMVEAMDGTIIERNKNFDSKGVSDYIAKPDYTKLSYDFDNSCVEQCVKDGTITMDALTEKGLLWKDENGDYNASGEMWEQFGSLWENDWDTLQDVGKEIPNVLTWNRKLQYLSNGQNFNGTKIDTNSSEYLSLLEKVIDVDEVVKYFASLSFIISMDNMFTWGQNYGLYIDKDRKATLVPWDHDLGWGGYFNPDTTEAVANWDIDQLYPKNFDEMGVPGLQAGMTREQIYSLVPMFHVIYQNNSLMEKYHAYMDDCTKIVSVGGTTSDGKAYESGRFAKTIDTLYPSITEAAGERMGENIYYVWNDGSSNRVTQPACAKEGIPMLKKLIALRSAGVWMQTHNKKANVTAYGCDLNKIGGASTGELSTAGILTAVNAETGIFATATYSSGNGGPLLTVDKLTSGSLYDTIKTKAGTDVTVYQMKNEKQPNSDYTLYLPTTPGKFNVYSYSESGGLTKLAATVYDNIYCVTTSDISNIVLAKEVSEPPKNQNGGGNNTSTLTTNNSSTTKDEKKKTTATAKKKATITVKKGKKKVSSVTVKKRKKVTLNVSVNSKGKLSLSKLTKKQKKIASVKLSGKKLTIKGKKKGSFSLKLTAAAKGAYKKATKKIKLKVK